MWVHETFFVSKQFVNQTLARHGHRVNVCLSCTEIHEHGHVSKCRNFGAYKKTFPLLEKWKVFGSNGKRLVIEFTVRPLESLSSQTLRGTVRCVHCTYNTVKPEDRASIVDILVCVMTRASKVQTELMACLLYPRSPRRTPDPKVTWLIPGEEVVDNSLAHKRCSWWRSCYNSFLKGKKMSPWRWQMCVFRSKTE